MEKYSPLNGMMRTPISTFIMRATLSAWSPAQLMMFLAVKSPAPVWICTEPLLLDMEWTSASRTRSPPFSRISME